MAWWQKATSRGVSRALPRACLGSCTDLNHWRESSTRETTETGLSDCSLASDVNLAMGARAGAGGHERLGSGRGRCQAGGTRRPGGHVRTTPAGVQGASPPARPRRGRRRGAGDLSRTLSFGVSRSPVNASTSRRTRSSIGPVLIIHPWVVKVALLAFAYQNRSLASARF